MEKRGREKETERGVHVTYSDEEEEMINTRSNLER
jgi:hypothetical protein